MRIALGADHGGYGLKQRIKDHLLENGHEILDYGTDSEQSADYPVYGFKVGAAVSEGQAELGIVICGTGIGISIAANKIKGIRAALCTNSFMARMAREHNNANILALGGRVIGSGLALEIVDTFLSQAFGGWRHTRRLDQIAEFEKC